jgi:hypothetical protein
MLIPILSKKLSRKICQRMRGYVLKSVFSKRSISFISK